MIALHEVSHGYGAKPCLKAVSLELAAGEIVGLCGRSGAGKSTLGRIMAGIVAPRQGQVLLDGTPYHGPRRGGVACVQYAPQASETAVDPHWRIGKILTNGGALPEDLCRSFGIAPDWLSRKPTEISGGQLARVSLARLFLPQVRFVVCDEIVAHLDALSAIEVLSALQQVVAERGVGILLVSHNKTLLRRFAHRCFALEEGQILRQD